MPNKNTNSQHRGPNPNAEERSSGNSRPNKQTANPPAPKGK